MKNTAMTLLAGLALAATAQAGDDYSAKGGKEIIPPPSCLWTWFAGGSAGTVQGGWDEDIYTLHIGVERKCPDLSCTHAFFLEVGWTEKDEDFPAPIIITPPPFPKYDMNIEIVPITLNYKYECVLSGKLNGYIGVGAGIALVDIDVDHNLGAPGMSADDTVFYGHIFAGLVYNVSESFEIFGGARLIIMEDPHLTGVSMFDDEAELNQDIHYEIGGRFNF